MKNILISISNISTDVNKDNFQKNQHSFKSLAWFRVLFRLPFPMTRRGCLAFLIRDAALHTAEASAILTGGGMQHSMYLEMKTFVN